MFWRQVKSRQNDLSPAQARLLLYRLFLDRAINHPQATVEMTESDGHQTRINGKNLSAYLTGLGILQEKLDSARAELAKPTLHETALAKLERERAADPESCELKFLPLAGSLPVEELNPQAQRILLHALATTGAIRKDDIFAPHFDDNGYARAVDENFGAYLNHLNVTPEQLDVARRALHENFVRRKERQEPKKYGSI